MTYWWLTNCPVDLGELSLCANWDFINYRSVHSSSCVLEKDIIKNRNNTVAIMSTCLTPTLESMDVSILTMIILTTFLSYINFLAEHSLGGAPYFPSMEMSNAWLDVSKTLPRSANAIYVWRLWLCLRCRSVLIVNVPS